jgi:hypothetical protein
VPGHFFSSQLHLLYIVPQPQGRCIYLSTHHEPLRADQARFIAVGNILLTDLASENLKGVQSE